MSMVFCRGCGKEIHESAPVCPHCGAPQKIQPAVSIKPAAVPKIEELIPDGIKGWSWGAFLLNWVWAIGNKTWIGLLALIPYVGFVMAIILGFKGREWAWKNKQWDSVEHFNRVQKKWSYWGVMIVVISVVIGVVAAIGIPAYKSYQDRAEAVAYNKQEASEQQAELARQSALLAEQKSNDARQIEPIQTDSLSPDPASCTSIAERAEKEGSPYYPSLTAEVIGLGKLYFHAAPDSNCVDQNVFVIPKDPLLVYVDYNGWMKVEFENTKSGQTFEGWVKSDRVKLYQYRNL